MKYFGVPVCPYCRKRVNLIRTWSLKRQGEYRCPRCGGISNIFLSPLIYVFALLAVVSGGAMYFFHKFVLDDVSLDTVIQVLVPFAVFFLLSLFMVYLEKPVIKQVPKAEIDRRRRKAAREEARRNPQRARPQGEGMFYEEEEYLPRTDYRTGPLPVSQEPARQTELDQTSVVKVPAPGARHAAPRPMTQAQAAAPTRRAEPARPVEVPSLTRPVQPAASARQTEPVRRTAPEAAAAAPAEDVFEIVTPRSPAGSGTAPKASGGEISNEDFFAKYDDPAYVERRLREINGQRDGQDA